MRKLSTDLIKSGSFTGSFSGSFYGLSPSSSYALTASYSNNSTSASYSLNSTTATNLSGGTINTTSITASNISASSISIDNATFNNITSNGPINLSGSNAYIQLFPITSSSIPSNFTASYIYTNKSTNDLYFTHYNGTHTSTTRLSWLDSNMYTGILFGGTLSSTPGSTTFNIASGSGLIVTMNATTGSDPNPTIKEIDWGNYTNIPIIYSSSAQITYVGIDSTGQIVQQTNAWGSSDIDQWDAEINLGVVLHLSGSVSTGVFNSPQISYGYPQKTDDFIRAFGSLKISGHTIQASGSTLGITKTGGVAFREGANYNINPNHPSSVVENAITSSKIFRYYLSGSTPVIDTGINNAGYPTLDITKYNNNGTLTSLSGSGASQFTIQRVFWIPNSPTNAFIVYYGNSVYGTLLDAQNGVNTEAFTEAPNTALNAIFTAYVITEGDCTDLITTGKSTIVQGGLFRSVGGIGAGGTSPATTDLNSLSDVAIAGPSQGDLLIYGNGTQWVNSKTLVGAYTLSGSLVTNDGITAVSINATSITGSLLGTSSLASNAISSSFSSVSVSSSYARTASNLSPVAQDLIPISNSLYSLGSPTNKWKDLYVSTGSIYIGDSVLSTSGSTLYSDALPIVTFNTSSGQIQVTGITSSLSSSFANTSSIALNTISSSYALSSSYARTASNSITANSATSASYALTSSYSFVANAAVTATSANTANSANAATSASYALTASFASNAGSSLTTGSTYPITASWSVSSSYVVNAGNSTSSSFASTASYVENSVSSSYALTASYALVAGSGGSGGSSSTSSLIGQTFVPTASVSQLSLTQSVSNNDQILVILDGLVQSRTGSYTVTGSTLNLTENADSGSIIDVRFLAGSSVSSSYATTSSYLTDGSQILTDNRTVAFSSSFTTAQMQALINAQPKNLGGKTLTFQFADGTYNLSTGLIFDHFSNGEIYINGNSSNNTVAAAKNVTISGSNPMYIANNSTYISVNYLKLIISTNSYTGCLIVENTNMRVNYCSFTNNPTSITSGTGHGVIGQNGATVLVYYSYFTFLDADIVAGYNSIVNALSNSQGSNASIAYLSYGGGIVQVQNTGLTGNTTYSAQLGGLIVRPSGTTIGT